MRVKIGRKTKHFLKIKTNSNSAKNQMVPKKWKIDIGFLGRIEVSTNGGLLGEIKKSILHSGLADAKDDWGPNWFSSEPLLPLHS
jgi:hypothetical protein